MTIREIEKKLPNGLHDAILKKHQVDYQNGIVEFYLDVWVGDLDSKDESIREKYLSGILRFTGLQYFVFEAPANDGKAIETLMLSAGDFNDQSVNIKSQLPNPLPGNFITYFFINSLNCFIFICASKVAFDYGI